MSSNDIYIVAPLAGACTDSILSYIFIYELKSQKKMQRQRFLSNYFIHFF